MKIILYLFLLFQIIGFCATYFCTGSIASLTAVAINRYLFICHQNTYKTLFNRRSSIGIAILACWVLGFAVASPTVLGWGGVGYSPVAALCGYDPLRSLTHLIYITLMGIVIPMSLTFACYGKIAYTLWESKRRLATHAQGNGSNNNIKKHTQVRTMFIVSALFTLFWCPYGVQCILLHFVYVQPVLFRYAGWLGLLNSCVNSITLGIINKKYRDAFKTIICCGNMNGIGKSKNKITVMTMNNNDG